MFGFGTKTGSGKWLKVFFRDQHGTTAVEYAVIAAGIFVVLLVAFSFYSGSVSDMYEQVADKVTENI